MPTSLNDIGARLTTLPGCEPPAHGWDAVLAARGRRAARATPRWPAALAGLALLAAGGLAWLAGDADGDRDDRNGPQRPAALFADTTRLESQRLERLLAALPERRAMRGGTAYTVAWLEDRLAAVDDRLSVTAIEPHAPEHADRLWRERVELLDSLVKVRYADVADSP